MAAIVFGRCRLFPIQPMTENTDAADAAQDDERQLDDMYRDAIKQWRDWAAFFAVISAIQWVVIIAFIGGWL